MTSQNFPGLRTCIFLVFWFAAVSRTHQLSVPTRTDTIFLEPASNILDLPARMWRMAVGLSTGVPYSRLHDDGSQLLLRKAQETMNMTRVRVNWNLCKGSAPFLGGANVLAREGYIYNEVLGPDCAPDVRFFLPAALGWSIEERNTSHIYQLAASAKIRILSCNAFQLDDVPKLLDLKRLQPDSVKEMMSCEDSLTEFINLVVRARSFSDITLKPLIPRGAVFENPRWDGEADVVAVEDVQFILPPRQCREVVVRCLCMQPPHKLPRGKRLVTCFTLQVASDVIDPLDCHRNLWAHQHCTSGDAMCAPSRVLKASLREQLQALGNSATILNAWPQTATWSGSASEGDAGTLEGRAWDKGSKVDLDVDEQDEPESVLSLRSLALSLPFDKNMSIYPPPRQPRATVDDVLMNAKYGSHLIDYQADTPSDHDEAKLGDVSDTASTHVHKVVAVRPSEEDLTADRMRHIWGLVHAHEYAEPFRLPVTAREAPDYKHVIQRPMALSNVKVRLDERGFASGKDFAEDMDVIFRNAMQYNEDGSTLFNMAARLQRFLWVNIFSNDATQENKRNVTFPMRAAPNVLIAGTPGTGKSTTVNAVKQLMQSQLGITLECVNVGDVIKEKDLGVWNQTDECREIDEDAEGVLLDSLEDSMQRGGRLVEYHSCSLFPERWFDLVVVLQSDISALHKRLTARGYTADKVSNNVECEIMCVVSEEARESYAMHRVRYMQSDTHDDVTRNAQEIATFFREWNANGSSAEEHARQVENEQIAVKMLDVWRQVCDHTDAPIFRKPVTKREAPDYHTIISRPMALSNIRRKLAQEGYSSVDEFLDDMDLIFRNAMVYNKAGSIIHKMAERLQKFVWSIAGELLAAEAQKQHHTTLVSPLRPTGELSRQDNETANQEVSDAETMMQDEEGKALLPPSSPTPIAKRPSVAPSPSKQANKRKRRR